MKFLIILFCVMLDTESRCQDQHVTGSSESMIDIATLNHTRLQSLNNDEK